MEEFQRQEVKSTLASVSSLGNGSNWLLQPISRAHVSLKMYITSQEEERRAAQKKKEPPSAKTHNPFSHIRPENVCSGCLCCREGRSLGGGRGWGSVRVLYHSVHLHALACLTEHLSEAGATPLPASSLLHSPCFFSIALGQNKGGCFHTGRDCSVLCLGTTVSLRSSPPLLTPPSWGVHTAQYSRGRYVLKQFCKF